MFYFLCIIWLEQKLIPNLPPNSVIVPDNADDKPPSFSSKRDVMKVWLDTRGIRYPEDSTKVELFQLIKINKPTFQLFSNDSLLARYAHVALRLPPYHPEPNTIEKMWAMVKIWVAMTNVTFQLEDVRKLAKKNSPALKKNGCPYVNTYKKWRRNTYKMKMWSTTLPRNWLSSLCHLIQT
jgi:hypothetical protein